MALSVMVTLAVFAPVEVGAKWPWIEQLAPTARLVPQLLAKTNCDAFVPVTAMLVIVSVAVPVLVMVTYCDALDVPTVTEPNDRLAAVKVTGPAGATPVPVSEIDCGELLALSVMVIAAVFAPAAVGAKCPCMVQLAPTARVVPQLLAKTNCDAPVPVNAMLLMVKAAVPVLLIVTDCELLVSPTEMEPNARLVAESVTGRGMPVPVSAMVCVVVGLLSVRVTAALNAPTAAGAKWPWIVQLAPAARLAPQLFANTNEDASAPVTAMLVIGTAAVPVLVSVTNCDPLVSPTIVVGYERLAAERARDEVMV